MGSKIFKYNKIFTLESGEKLPCFELAYRTFGRLNEKKDNVVWVFHALTANDNPFEWWSGLFGKSDYFNEDEYFIVCANVLGACYGSTGPASETLPEEYKYGKFPLLTIRDLARTNHLLKEYLEIDKVHVAIGGSFGGYQALEFAYDNDQLDHLILIATGAEETPWNIAIHETQRQAIASDGNFNISNDYALKGLAAARGIGILTYRTPNSFVETQTREVNQIKDFRASSYIQYQGQKLAQRFSPWTYYKLTQCLDTHDLSRERGSLEEALSRITANTLLIGIEEDLLTSAETMQKLQKLLPRASYKSIHSQFGHDGFLLETKQITEIITQFKNQSK